MLIKNTAKINCKSLVLRGKTVRRQRSLISLIFFEGARIYTTWRLWRDSLRHFRVTKAAYAAANVAIDGLMATFVAALKNSSDEQLLDHLTAVKLRLLKKFFIVGLMKATMPTFVSFLCFSVLRLPRTVINICFSNKFASFEYVFYHSAASVTPQMSDNLFELWLASCGQCLWPR